MTDNDDLNIKEISMTKNMSKVIRRERNVKSQGTIQVSYIYLLLKYDYHLQVVLQELINILNSQQKY